MRHPLSPRALALVAAGGAIGALGRYGLVKAFPVGPGPFPTTTFLINVVGAFVLAALLGTLQRRGTPDHWARLVVGVGVLGAFTTFSTMAVELAGLWRDGHEGTALLYATASLIVGIGAVFAGLRVVGLRGGSLRAPVPAEDES